MVQLNERAGVEEVVHRVQNRSSRSVVMASDQELVSIAVIRRTSS
jgi:ribosomal protein L7Ae-like RNA K-turn-binding protein